jgi:hypothetical protein
MLVNPIFTVRSFWSLGWDLSMHRAYGRGHTVASRFLTGRFSIPDRMPLKYQSILVTAA